MDDVANSAATGVSTPSEGPSPVAVTGRPATIYDVAKFAGVSHQTVSRHLQGYEGIRPATRARVEAAIHALDYRPNLTARSLTTGRSHRLGALTHEIDQVGPSKIVRGATVAAREAGFVLDIVTLDTTDVASIDRALALVVQHDLEGVLALSSTDEMTEAFSHVSFRLPALIATEPDEVVMRSGPQLLAVGFPALVAHLHALGHRSFLHLAGPQNWSAARNRRRAFEAAVRAADAASVGVLAGDWSARSGYAAIAALDRVEATAIVAANDQMALGALLALQERGLRVPEDVSVTGVDDIPEAAYFTPPLTTLRVDFEGQGRNSVLELLARIEGVEDPPAPPVSAELVTRASTGPARP